MFITATIAITVSGTPTHEGTSCTPTIGNVNRWIHNFTFPFVGAHEVPPWVGITITIVAIVAVMNMVNFLDGLDGLAAGVCAISAFSFCLIELSQGQPAAAILTAIVFGACLGFLRHNFYPARIFMGDSGALLLGFTLASVAVQGLLKTAALTSLVLPLLVLAVPLIDTSFVVARRIKNKQPVYLADRSHLHHRFQAVGFSHRRTVLYLYGWTITMAALAVAVRFIPYTDDRGHWNLGWSIVLAGCFAVAFAASVYLVLVLEILKLRRLRAWQLRHADPATTDAEVDAEVERELETGEFRALETQ